MVRVRVMMVVAMTCALFTLGSAADACQDGMTTIKTETNCPPGSALFFVVPGASTVSLKGSALWCVASPSAINVAYRKGESPFIAVRNPRRDGSALVTKIVPCKPLKELVTMYQGDMVVTHVAIPTAWGPKNGGQATDNTFLWAYDRKRAWDPCYGYIFGARGNSLWFQSASGVREFCRKSSLNLALRIMEGFRSWGSGLSG